MNDLHYAFLVRCFCSCVCKMKITTIYGICFAIIYFLCLVYRYKKMWFEWHWENSLIYLCFFVIWIRLFLFVALCYRQTTMGLKLTVCVLVFAVYAAHGKINFIYFTNNCCTIQFLLILTIRCWTKLSIINVRDLLRIWQMILRLRVWTLHMQVRSTLILIV